MNRLMLSMCVVLPVFVAACDESPKKQAKKESGTTTSASTGAAKSSGGDAMAAGLVGSWKVAEATGPGASGNKGVAYKFDKDGNVLLGGFNKCTYTHTAPDLQINCSGVKIDWKAEMKDGSTVVLTNAAKQVLTLKRE